MKHYFAKKSLWKTEFHQPIVARDQIPQSGHMYCGNVRIKGQDLGFLSSLASKDLSKTLPIHLCPLRKLHTDAENLLLGLGHLTRGRASKELFGPGGREFEGTNLQLPSTTSLKTNSLLQMPLCSIINSTLR